MLVKNTPYVQFAAVTAESVKEYFDVSVYRNVLDMLNTFDGILNLWGNDLYNNSLAVLSDNVTRGYSIPFVGVVGLYGSKSPIALAIKRLKESGINYGLVYPINPARPYGGSSLFYKPSLRLTRNTVVFDLLGLARNINWELNRVRLPIPHNFRQIADKIQGRNYSAISSSTDFINLVELIQVYKQLKDAIKILRVSTRKEIDAANLARKVQEETLRREQEALITRQAAEKLAEENRLKILAERKAALEREFAEAEALKIKLAETRAQLAAEFELLEQSKQVATPTEIPAIESKQTQVIDAIEKVEIVAIDKNAALDTAKQAAINVNNELIEVKQEKVAIADIILTDLEQQKAVSTQQEIEQIEQQQQTIIKETQTFEPIYIPPANVNISLPESKTLAPTTENSNLIPILLTVAAGAILL